MFFNNQTYNITALPTPTNIITNCNTQQLSNVYINGSCPVDTDLDGIYDMYEVNLDNSILNTDTNGNPNWNDTDDDGDGILSIYEGNDPNGDHDPTDALDTDNDGKKDYLDVDDDNDGYATWEISEGGLGLFNNTIIGIPYTANTDGDSFPNYLDASNGFYPVNGPVAYKNYLSLIGDKRYELANHLGNVLVVINDKKLPEFKIPNSPTSGLVNFNADVLSYNDYYPFGMLVPCTVRSHFKTKGSL